VLLDEPFSGLDAGLRAETREAVLHALREERATAVLVTHDQAEALSMGHEVAVLRDGRLAQRATPGVLYRTPVDVEVASFVGEANLTAGHARGGLVECALGGLDVANPGLEGPVEVLVRPEQIRLSRDAGNGVPDGEGAVAARVLEHVYYGAESVLRLALERAGGTVVKARVSGQQLPGAGELVVLAVHGPVVVVPPRSIRTEDP
jgi:iron(III) transport system ATP-binding protein